MPIDKCVPQPSGCGSAGRLTGIVHIHLSLQVKRIVSATVLGAIVLLANAGNATAADIQAAKSSDVIHLWQGPAPGTTWSGPEVHIPAGAKTPWVIKNVTVPTLTIYRPAKSKATGAAMIVAPGGGFQGLAYKQEGAMVAQWLADRGVTAFVLKYRVHVTPGPHGAVDARHHPAEFDKTVHSLDPSIKIAVADGIKAMHIVRSNAAKYRVVPDRIGFMGFSAGAITTLGVVMAAPPADRPNLAASIYGFIPSDKAPPADAPPLFIAAAQDDSTVPVTKSVDIFTRWTSANLPAELHIYQNGGHGFGMLTRHLSSDHWPSDFANWLKLHHWIAGWKEAFSYSTKVTPLGTLLDDPKAHAVLERLIPQMVNSPGINRARNLTLIQLQTYAPKILTSAMLAKIDKKLAAIE